MRIIGKGNNDGKRTKIMRKITVLILVLILFSCHSSEAVLFSFHPQEKLKEADYMMSINRPIAADLLIDEVIRFCAKKNNEPCLVDAYFSYGKLLMWQTADVDKFYKIASYVDKNITTDNVNQKSVEYFEKALALAKKHEMDANASAIYIKIGILQFTRFKDQASACESFDQGLRYNQMFQKNNPEKRVVLPKGFKSFEDYISEGKKEMGCSK